MVPGQDSSKFECPEALVKPFDNARGTPQKDNGRRIGRPCQTVEQAVSD